MSELTAIGNKWMKGAIEIPRFGLLPLKDVETLQRTMDLVTGVFADETIYTCDIGVHQGLTAKGIHEYLKGKGRKNLHTGIDNLKDQKRPINADWLKMIIGSSIHVVNQIQDESQHLLFIDGNHSLFFTTADFLLYKDKVKLGGFIAFHDTSVNIPRYKDYQGGDQSNPYDYIACREAVQRLGLYNNAFPGFQLMMDEYDTVSQTGGITVVQKMPE
jgi:Methyltransferase domain